MSSDEIVDVIDLNDQFLYSVPRSDTMTQKLRCRVVHSFLIDRVTRDVMLLVRSRHSGFCPLHFGAVGGYVHSSEAWDVAASREVMEEVGIDVPMQLLEKYAVTDPITERPFIDGVFAGFIDRADVVIDTEAVDSVVFMPLTELTAMDSRTHKMHPLLMGQIAILARHYDRLIAV